MHHVAGRARSPGPDRDRQQHHVHHRKTGHAQPRQQVTPGFVAVAIGQHRAIERFGGVAQRRQLGDQQIFNIGQIGGGDGYPLQGQVDAGAKYIGAVAQLALDRRDTGGTMHRG